jgi:hypothetical protein
MSALGQKQTCALQQAMSALPPKADNDARAGPKKKWPGDWKLEDGQARAAPKPRAGHCDTAYFICFCSRRARHDCSPFVGPSRFVKCFRSGQLRRQQRPIVLRLEEADLESLLLVAILKLSPFDESVSKSCGPTLMPHVFLLASDKRQNLRHRRRSRFPRV